MANLAVRNRMGLLKCDRQRLVKSPSKFCLPLTTAFYVLFTRWIYEITIKDFGKRSIWHAVSDVLHCVWTHLCHFHLIAAKSYEPGPTLVCRATLRLKCRQIVPANHRAALQMLLQYASCLVSFTFEVFLFAQRPERQVGSDMVDHCVQTALKLTHQRDRQRDRGRGEARRTKKEKKRSPLTCRVAGRVVPTPGCL